MEGNFFYVRNKKSGLVSRVIAKPYLGQNSEVELLTEEEVAELRKPKPAKFIPPSNDVDDLLAGFTDGEDGG